ncbi:MAG: MarR family transcriptional regulator [Gammaproteobacteria bacterium]|nr:MarR family transcriptional regulator [Gammaproteobacteria bacterium]MDE1887511.1 MarR family transcriptional regulator [Gammaproteobacteria bacterium]MDE2024556.1 MarR family transcriptional regulator [Gammaproteobacteria bacterium]MDE2139029.1 MarR family transcriptional regulator [Gammaproteobacteria bacterium]MDE2273303.1 MarR family transcriptional regulator [Gammaproteobacteria bacterium]
MTTNPNRLAADILLALRRIMRSMDISSRQLIGERGLTTPQLLCLQNLGEHGAMTSGMLAQMVSLSPATVTGILDRLELRGLVTRERRPEDKRHVLVTVTDAGAAAADAAPSRLAQRFADALAHLPEDDRSEVLRVIQYLADLADVRNGRG